MLGKEAVPTACPNTPTRISITRRLKFRTAMLPAGRSGPKKRNRNSVEKVMVRPTINGSVRRT